MEWVTTETLKGEEKRHVLICAYIAGEGIIDTLICGSDFPLQVDDNPKAPKCKNCLKVLKKLIEK